jgi:hypothetical protein
MGKTGGVTFGLKTGKTVGPFPGDLEDGTPKDGPYLDVTKGGKDYPTKLDFGKLKAVVSITFKPGVGKGTTWTSWTYLNNGQWAVDRFTGLG